MDVASIGDSVQLEHLVKLFDRDRSIGWVEWFFTPSLLPRQEVKNPDHAQSSQESDPQENTIGRAEISDCPQGAILVNENLQEGKGSALCEKQAWEHERALEYQLSPMHANKCQKDDVDELQRFFDDCKQGLQENTVQINSSLNALDQHGQQLAEHARSIRQLQHMINDYFTRPLCSSEPAAPRSVSLPEGTTRWEV